MAQTDVLNAPLSINPVLNKPRIEETVPELEAGDHLTRREFHRRYEAMPHLKKAELIEGKVYMRSPVKLNHAEIYLFSGRLVVLVQYDDAQPKRRR